MKTAKAPCNFQQKYLKSKPLVVSSAISTVDVTAFTVLEIFNHSIFIFSPILRV